MSFARCLLTGYLLPAQYAKVLGGGLSYPMFFAIRNVFANRQAMNQLVDVHNSYLQQGMDVETLATFVG